MKVVHIEMAVIQNTLSKNKTRRPIHMISFVPAGGGGQGESYVLALILMNVKRWERECLQRQLTNLTALTPFKQLIKCIQIMN